MSDSSGFGVEDTNHFRFAPVVIAVVDFLKCHDVDITAGNC
jgi:hypothetical protein